jgi:hypothetical protein
LGGGTQSKNYFGMLEAGVGRFAHRRAEHPIDQTLGCGGALETPLRRVRALMHGEGGQSGRIVVRVSIDVVVAVAE